MLRRKQQLAEKKAEQDAAKEQEKMEFEEQGTAATNEGESGEGKEDGKESGVKLLGIGGKSSRSGNGVARTGKKRTPGELRIQKDISELDSGDVGEVTFPNPNDLCKFVLEVSPDSGYWKGAKYKFTFMISPGYPHDPPKVHCETKIYHPNIDLQGNVCHNILRDEWKPVLDINAVIYGIIYLFYEPNTDDPLNKEAANLLRSEKAQFARLVKNTLMGYSHNGESFQRLI